MLEFIKGCAVVRQGRKVVAKVYDQPAFFEGKSVWFDPAMPYALEIRVTSGVWMGAKFPTIDELMPHLQKHLAMDYGKI